jgi:hypothetical protein
LTCRELNIRIGLFAFMAEKVPEWLERILLPQISELKGEVKATNARLDGEFKAVHSEIRRLDEKIDGLDKRMDFVQRLAIVEGKVSELEGRR